MKNQNDKIQMKQVMTKVLAKFPYPLLRVEGNSSSPATELDKHTSSNTISCNGIGKNFQNVPQEAKFYSRGTERIDYSFINTEAGVSVNINGSHTSIMRNLARFTENVNSATELLNEKNIQSDIIVCVIITIHSKKGEHKYVMILSEPMTIKTIAAKRLSAIQKDRDKVLNDKLDAIATIWE